MEESRKRLFISRRTNDREREKLIKLALENGCNTLVFALNDKFFKKKSFKYSKLINEYDMNVEAGGRDFPLLLPRRLFFTNRGLFRMEQGRRRISHHFCPTNPQTTAIVSGNAKTLFAGVLDKVTLPRIFHLLPDEGHDNTWCACPACRAFNPEEQYLFAIKTAADALFLLDPEAVIINFDCEKKEAANSEK
ncbi:MAG: hypothetical protein FWC21_02920 [Treponema sp.]|nr:hypothetical protein [Treponema sp.]